MLITYILTYTFSLVKESVKIWLKKFEFFVNFCYFRVLYYDFWGIKVEKNRKISLFVGMCIKKRQHRTNFERYCRKYFSLPFVLC